MTDRSADFVSDLYAVIAYLHPSANRDLLEAIRRAELTFPEANLLDRLRSGGPGSVRSPSVNQVASMLFLSQAGASRTIAGLRSRSLLETAAGESDNRFRHVTITAGGERAFLQLHAPREDRIRSFIEGLDDEMRELLSAALRPLLERDEIAAIRSTIDGRATRQPVGAGER